MGAWDNRSRQQSLPRGGLSKHKNANVAVGTKACVIVLQTNLQQDNFSGFLFVIFRSPGFEASCTANANNAKP